MMSPVSGLRFVDYQSSCVWVPALWGGAGGPSQRPLTPRLLSPTDRNELEAAQKFLEQAAIENLVSM